MGSIQSLDWTGLVDWTSGMEICGKYIRNYSQFVLRINYLLLYSTTKYMTRGILWGRPDDDDEWNKK